MQTTTGPIDRVNAPLAVSVLVEEMRIKPVRIEAKTAQNETVSYIMRNLTR